MTNKERIPTALISPEESMIVPRKFDDVSSSAGGNHLVAYSLTHATVLLLSEGARQEVKLASPPSHLNLSVDVSANLIAYCSKDGVLRVRHIGSKQETVIKDCIELVDSRFDELGRLWTVRGEGELRVELRSAGDWRVIGVTQVKDLGGGADLRPGPSPESVILAPYSGQSEQENYVCEFKNENVCARLLSAMDGDQFVFATSRNKTVVTLDHNQIEISCFSNPELVSHSSLKWPHYDEEECEDERPGYYGCFLNNNHFLAGSSEGRLFVFQLNPLQVEKEILVAGYEPVPIGNKYPRFKGAPTMVSDLLFFGRCGDHVAAFFASDHRSKQRQLVTLREPDILDQTEL